MTHVIIAGGSLAGLVTAKAISPYFDSIDIFEADSKSEDLGPRKGVPQGRHVHGLLKGGANALINLFPDLPEKLEANGATSADFCRDVKWYINKRFMPRFSGSIPIYFQSRPLLEYCIREEVSALENVQIHYGTKVSDFTYDPSEERVTGVVTGGDHDTKYTHTAELVIDATGRGSLLPKWLKQKKLGEVPTENTVVNLGYASCFLKLPPDSSRDWSSLLVYPTGPTEVRGCTLVSVENDKWLLTLAGYHKDHPPADREGFLEFARKLPRPEVYEAVKDAEFLSEISLHKFPSSQYRKYFEMSDFPAGIIPVGDTNISLNPLFGQGMSVAILSATSLGDVLAQTDFADKGAYSRIATVYHRRLRQIFTTPWDLAMGQDFKYPETVGKKPFGWRIKNIFKDLILSSKSEDVIESFFKVVHLVDKEWVFYHPKRALKVLMTSNKQ
ncbi:FAD-dependent oxidoreductase [Sneathiella glossodoripedis]|uniref:FAD-dependent oxidoreductase n=1 Tax=Sneathiella glossodoripedis TaxID=418853 RepID=UPI000470713A|nr:FAD-dependent monooxygenase [Sneathiella glossodoripedis]